MGLDEKVNTSVSGLGVQKEPVLYTHRHARRRVMLLFLWESEVEGSRPVYTEALEARTCVTGRRHHDLCINWDTVDS